VDINAIVGKASEGATGAIDELRALLLGKGTGEPDQTEAGNPTPSNVADAISGSTTVVQPLDRIGYRATSATAASVAQQGGNATTVAKVALVKEAIFKLGRVACLASELQWLKAGIGKDSTANEGIDGLLGFLLSLILSDVEIISAESDLGQPISKVVSDTALEMNVDFRSALELVEGLPEAFKAELTKAGAKLNEEHMMHLQSAHDHIAAMTSGDACQGGDVSKASSADRARLKVVHDHMGAMGATCRAAKAAFQAFSPLRKSLETITEEDLQIDNPNLPLPIVKLLGRTNGLEFQLSKMGTTVGDLVKEVKALKDTPLPGKGVTKFTTISKGQDVGSQGGNGQLSSDDQGVVTAYLERLNKLDETQRTKELIKLSLAQPVFHAE
jgi:hypothetical protein